MTSRQRETIKTLKLEGSCRLFVRNVSDKIDHHIIRDAFSVHGNVLLAYNTRKGYAFVHYASFVEARYVVGKMNDTILGGRNIEVKIATYQGKNSVGYIISQLGGLCYRHTTGECEKKNCPNGDHICSYCLEVDGIVLRHSADNPTCPNQTKGYIRYEILKQRSAPVQEGLSASGDNVKQLGGAAGNGSGHFPQSEPSSPAHGGPAQSASSTGPSPKENTHERSHGDTPVIPVHVGSCSVSSLIGIRRRSVSSKDEEFADEALQDDPAYKPPPPAKTPESPIQQQQYRRPNAVKFGHVNSAETAAKAFRHPAIKTPSRPLNIATKQSKVKAQQQSSTQMQQQGRGGLFGASTTNTTGGMFGQQQNKSLLGTSGFGDRASRSAPAFGEFGAQPAVSNTGGLFGAPKPAFGVAPTAAGGLGGSGTFHLAPTGEFGAQPPVSNTGGLFGVPKPAFGVAPPTTATAGFGGFGTWHLAPTERQQEGSEQMFRRQGGGAPKSSRGGSFTVVPPADSYDSSPAYMSRSSYADSSYDSSPAYMSRSSYAESSVDIGDISLTRNSQVNINSPRNQSNLTEFEKVNLSWKMKPAPSMEELRGYLRRPKPYSRDIKQTNRELFPSLNRCSQDLKQFGIKDVISSSPVYRKEVPNMNFFELEGERATEHPLNLNFSVPFNFDF